eukprot:Phypoly_transcript_08812.p1 GENE.Phypoly_transcript_08812~~Phypoly_transcript_08812.p1  ORF type:complete len:415 (+),score=43.52 Phypoly_transcript_08812:129-1373(+)
MAGSNNIIFLIKEIRGPAISPDESLNVYRAVKKQPFFIIISSSFPQVDFHTAKVTACLRYQTDTLPGKDVTFIKANPLEFSTKVVEVQSEETIHDNISSTSNTNNNNSHNANHNTSHNTNRNYITLNKDPSGAENNNLSNTYITNLNGNNYNIAYNNPNHNSAENIVKNTSELYNTTSSTTNNSCHNYSNNNYNNCNNPNLNYNTVGNYIGVNTPHTHSNNLNRFANSNYYNSDNNFNIATNIKSIRKEENNSNKRLELEVEAKILTLSSQHQGAYFYIHIQLKLVSFGQEIYCELDTPPIQVISKKGSNHTPIQRRKPASDIITAALNRIEESEYQKTDWLSQLCTNSDKNALRANVWWQDGSDISSLLARMCFSFRNMPSPQRALAIATELSNLGSFEKNVIDYIVANLRIN